MKTQNYAPSRIKALSKAAQRQKELFWNRQLASGLACIPYEAKVQGLGMTEARMRNTNYGRFAARYFKWVIDRLTDHADICRRRTKEKKIVGVGYGWGYDSYWLRKAAGAGFWTWWVDVSSIVWIQARMKLYRQFDLMPRSIQDTSKKPEIKTPFEIQSLLAEPDRAELDVASVEIWFLSRLLNCLSTRSAKSVLQEIGRVTFGADNPDSMRNAVIIINALRDENPDLQGTTSIIRSRQELIANLRFGAGRPIEAKWIKPYEYFTQNYTAMTVMVKA